MNSEKFGYLLGGEEAGMCAELFGDAQALTASRR